MVRKVIGLTSQPPLISPDSIKEGKLKPMAAVTGKAKEAVLTAQQEEAAARARQQRLVDAVINVPVDRVHRLQTDRDRLAAQRNAYRELYLNGAEERGRRR